MLAKAFAQVARTSNTQPNSLFQVAQRGIYKAGTEPHVFVNKHTKVICQGMTGKHVST